jgi:serine/threonine protein kinase
LKRIESRAFDQLNVDIVISSKILFVASNAISNPFQITFDDCNCCPEFDRWRQLREQDISVDFRRILKFDSDLADLTAYLIDVSRFEEGSVEGGCDRMFGQKYLRLDDGCLIVVKSMNLSDSVDNKEVEKEIEKELNLCHPCIAGAIGFILPIESSGLRELKIGRFYIEGCSLAAVILMNPLWWTPTMKAKAIVGIALGLEFAHSLGIIHGNLNSDSIVFDEFHQIEITNFGFIEEDMDENEGESESVIGSDGFCEGLIGQADLRAFGSLLIGMMIGQEVADFVSKMIEAIGSRDYAEINSMKCIVNFLKANDFEIERGVVSVEVWEFVEWIETWEESNEYIKVK